MLGGVKISFQETLKAIADPTRRDILTLLKSGALTAGDICSHFSITGASISHHLSVLKASGLVDDDKRGKYIFYELNTSVVDELLAWILDLKGGKSLKK